MFIIRYKFSIINSLIIIKSINSVVLFLFNKQLIIVYKTNATVFLIRNFHIDLISELTLYFVGDGKVYIEYMMYVTSICENLTVIINMEYICI